MMSIKNNLFSVFCLLSSVFSLQSCYYLQAVEGQIDLLSRRQPIAEILANPDTSPRLTEKLQIVLKIREFSRRELHLPDNGSYNDYADLERPYAVWNVFAAPEFSLTPAQSCFLLVGCLSYRGYFSKTAALAFAKELRQEGYEVYTGGVAAYSTLGWFADPVLNTMLGWSDADLAGLIFHELAHQKIYAPDDSTFNESFATAVEQAGIERWLVLQPPSQVISYRQSQARETAGIALAQKTYRQLTALYQQNLPPEIMRARKQAIFSALQAEYAELKNQWQGDKTYDKWFAEDLNNAKLLTVLTYHDYVPYFLALLAQKQGDFPAFYAQVEALSRLPPAERLQQLFAQESRN